LRLFDGGIEWFDVKAGIIGKEFQVYRGEPEFLWVYLVEQKR
jgi:hypothetical protein